MRFAGIVICILLLSSCTFSPKTEEPLIEPSYTCTRAWEVDTNITGRMDLMQIDGNWIYFINGSQKNGKFPKICCVNLDTGEKRWESINIAGYLQSLIITSEYVYLFVDNDSNMLCFDKNTGVLLATVKFDINTDLAKDKTVWLGSVTSDGQYLIWGAGSGLYKFDTKSIDFSKAATEIQIILPERLYEVPPYTGIASTPVVDNHVVYFMRVAYMDQLGENTIGAYDLGTNTLLWERKSNKMTGLVCDGMIIQDDWLYIVEAWCSTCLNKKTGWRSASSSDGERWVNNQDDPLGSILTTSAYGQGAALYNGKLYFTNSCSSNTWSDFHWPKDRVKNIICLDSETGEFLWGDMPAGVCGSMGAHPVAANGKLYISRFEGLRVYNAETGQLLGVDTTVNSSGRFSINQYYEQGKTIIFNCENLDGVSGKLIAIKAE